MQNERILVISDLHFPFHHKDTFEFLSAIKRKYKPDRVICIGDEVDNHAMSFHDTDPDLYSPADELRAARTYIWKLETMFPKMDIMESNHGSMFFRKSKKYGIPAAAMKSYNELWGVGPGWKWHTELTLKMSNGQKCYFHHGRYADVAKVSREYGMPAVQGHYHERYKIEYWANTEQLAWGMQVGCLADDHSLALAYNNTNLKRPIVGCGIIIDGHPKLLPMVLNKKHRWIKTLT